MHYVIGGKVTLRIIRTFSQLKKRYNKKTFSMNLNSTHNSKPNTNRKFTRIHVGSFIHTIKYTLHKRILELFTPIAFAIAISFVKRCLCASKYEFWVLKFSTLLVVCATKFRLNFVPGFLVLYLEEVWINLMKTRNIKVIGRLVVIPNNCSVDINIISVFK